MLSKVPGIPYCYQTIETHVSSPTPIVSPSIVVGPQVDGLLAGVAPIYFQVLQSRKVSQA